MAADVAALHSGVLLEMLRRHYQPEGKPPAGVFAPEVQSPDGRRRADLLWAPTTIAGGKGQIHGHELKCSRSDLLNELADPTKADPWTTHCHRWWLVMSRPDLADGLTIPDAWGIMAPPSGRRTRTMTILREAPPLRPDNPGPGMARVMAWQLYATHDRIASLEAEVARKTKALEGWQEKARDLQLAGGGAIASDQARTVLRIIEEVKRRCGDEGIWEKFTEEMVIEAIVDRLATIRAAGAVRRDIRSLVRNVEAMLTPFQASARDIQRADRLAATLTGPLETSDDEADLTAV